MKKENIDEDCHVLPEPDNIRIFNGDDENTKVIKIDSDGIVFPDNDIDGNTFRYSSTGCCILDNRNILKADFS